MVEAAQAKAEINLKEGVIILEGPVDFVRHYLDIYRIALQGMATTEGQTALARKRGRREGTSLTGAIGKEVEAGFFDEPRSVADVKNRLSEAGLKFTDSSLRRGLRRLARSGALVSIGRRRSLRYRHAGSSDVTQS